MTIAAGLWPISSFSIPRAISCSPMIPWAAPLWARNLTPESECARAVTAIIELICLAS